MTELILDQCPVEMTTYAIRNLDGRLVLCRCNWHRVNPACLWADTSRRGYAEPAPRLEDTDPEQAIARFRQWWLEKAVALDLSADRVRREAQEAREMAEREIEAEEEAVGELKGRQ